MGENKKIYLDMNIYNRIFDDQNQIRIRFETMAVDIILELIEKGNYYVCWSFMLEDENQDNPFVDRRDYIKTLSSICNELIQPHDEIRLLFRGSQESGFRMPVNN